MTKGQVYSFGLFQIMIVSFMVVVFFGGLIYVMGLINGVFQQAGVQNEVNAGQPGYVNMSQAANATFGKVNEGIQSLRLVALSLVFTMILSYVLMSAMVRAHPSFFFVHVLITMLAVFLAVPISNSYESLMNSSIYDGNLASFTGVNYLILNLPTIITLLGFLGGIFMFVGMIRPQGGLGELR